MGGKMKISEAISRIDVLKPNAYMPTEKIKWLNELDKNIKTQIIDTHEGASLVRFSGYTDETPTDTTLLVAAPFDEMYLYWLESRIDYYNGEQKKYNNSIEMFTMVYEEYARYYNRTHKPLGHKIKLF